MDNSALAFTTMAMMIPTIEAGMNQNWVTVLVTGLTAALAQVTKQELRSKEPIWLAWMRKIAIGIMIVWFLRKADDCWTGERAEYVVPAVLLLLALITVGKGKKVSESACSVLRHGMYAVLGILLIAGIKEIRWNEIKPKAQIPGEELAAVLFMPILVDKKENRLVMYWLAALMASIVAGTATGLCEYSKGISIAGVVEHIESLVACTVTIGYYGLLCWLLQTIGSVKYELWGIAIAAYILSITKIKIPMAACAGLIFLLWNIIPVLMNRIKRKIKKDEKRA